MGIDIRKKRILQISDEEPWGKFLLCKLWLQLGYDLRETFLGFVYDWKVLEEVDVASENCGVGAVMKFKSLRVACYK